MSKNSFAGIFTEWLEKDPKKGESVISLITQKQIVHLPLT